MENAEKNVHNQDLQTRSSGGQETKLFLRVAWVRPPTNVDKEKHEHDERAGVEEMC